MPISDWYCSECKKKWEVFTPHDDEPKECECGSKDIRKLIGKPGFKFIGPGFHRTDYVEKHDYEGTDYDINMRENEKLNKKLGYDK